MSPFASILALAGKLPKVKPQPKGRDLVKRRKWSRLYARKRYAELHSKRK